MANEKKITGVPGNAKADISEIKVLSRESAVSSHAPGIRVQRLGFIAGQISVPDDFDQMGSEEVERIFNVGKKNNK
jgi:hypothetical protein